jgi:hypothetical protein
MKFLFGASEEEATDEWINDTFYLYIKDNTPQVKSKYNTKKQRCEFCGRSHNLNDDYCEIRTDKHKDCNQMEACEEIVLQDLYDQL